MRRGAHILALVALVLTAASAFGVAAGPAAAHVPFLEPSRSSDAPAPPAKMT